MVMLSKEHAVVLNDDEDVSDVSCSSCKHLVIVVEPIRSSSWQQRVRIFGLRLEKEKKQKKK